MNIRTTWSPKDVFQAEDYNRIRHNFAECYAYLEVVDVDCSYVPTADDLQRLRNWFQVIANYYDIAIATSEIIPVIDLSGFNADDYPTTEGLFPPIGTIYPMLGRETFFPDAAELNLYERLCEYINVHFLGGVSNEQNTGVSP